MSLLATASAVYQELLAGTSGGPRQGTQDWVIGVGGVLSAQRTTTAGSQAVWVFAIAEQTTSGLPAAADNIVSTEQPVAELRRMSGLTWEQLATLFGVARRSVHFWASGKPMNASNEERLSRLLSVVRYINRGSARATRAAIMTAQADGVRPFDLLVADELDEVLERVGAGPQTSTPTLTPLSAAAQAARVPPPPAERIGALQDTVHDEVGRSRPAPAVRTKSKR